MLFLHEFSYYILQVVGFYDVSITGFFCCQNISTNKQMGNDVRIGYSTVFGLNVVDLSTVLDIVVEACDHLLLVAHLFTNPFCGPLSADFTRVKGVIARSWSWYHEIHLLNPFQIPAEKSLSHKTEPIRNICDKVYMGAFCQWKFPGLRLSRV